MRITERREKMRLIDADELKRTIKMSDLRRWEKVALYIALISAPTVDAVEVVRCRDCKHGSQYDDGSDNYVCGYGGTKKGSGFCSEGKRRDE